MKKLIFLLAFILLALPVFAYTTQSTYETGTATTAAISEISFSTMIVDFLILNDSSTSGQNIYVNPEGDLSAARITQEGFALKPGEFVIKDNFRTKKINILSASGTPTYRVWAWY